MTYFNSQTCLTPVNTLIDNICSFRVQIAVTTLGVQWQLHD